MKRAAQTRMPLLLALVLAIAVSSLVSTPALAGTGDPGTRPEGFEPPPLTSENALEPFYNTTGQITLSLDALGTTSSSGQINVDKPVGGTVRAAFMLVASTGYSGATIGNGEVLLEGTPLSWDASVPSTIYSWNYLCDVTSIVAPIVDAAPPGNLSLVVDETYRSLDIDGSVLAVVFDVPSLPREYTAVLFFGAQHIDGDDFTIGLNDPAHPDDPEYRLDLGLGISYGWQGAEQSSLIDINGERMTSSAGGQDDGSPDNGALITVGGIGDSTDNPDDPYSGPNGDCRQDDELYDLKPFVDEGDMLINVHTVNPSDDDNIFFAGLMTSGRVSITVDVEIVDANPVDLGHDVSSTANIPEEDVCNVGTIRTQTGCDGTSRLLMRLLTDQPGQVTVELDDPSNPNGLGSVEPLNGSGGGVTATAHTVETSRGHMAFFVYTPPNALYEDDPQFQATERRIDVAMDYDPDDGSATLEREAELTLHRPPVLLVHGVRSSPRAWNPQIWSVLDTQWGFDVEYADYEATNVQSLADNYDELIDRCDDLVEARHNEGVACAQINVVGHSMGGLLARRWHVDTDEYLEDANFNEGWINLLVTVDTPHHGSELAELFEEINENHTACNWLLSQNGIVYGPALDDLQTDSPNLLALGATSVPVHAIVGEGGTDDFADSHGEEARLEHGALDAACGMNLITPAIFGTEEHDFVVTSPSQQGGLASTYITTNDDAAGEHTACLRQAIVFQQVRNLLLAGPAASNIASGLPVPDITTQAVPASDGPADIMAMMPAVTIQNCGTIIEPSDGAIVQPGVPINVQADFGPEIQAAYLISKTGPPADLDPGSWTGTLVIPEIFAGDIEYRLVGFDAEGELCASEPILLQVQPTAAVTELFVQPSTVSRDRAGVDSRLSISGLFDDGIYRPANSPLVGTTYFSHNTSVATVDDRGQIHTEGPGVTSIVVRNGSLEATVRVVVGDEPANQAPIATFVQPTDICVGDLVCFDGSGSYDPDAEPEDNLVMSWDLDGDGVFDDAFDAQPCLVYTAAGEIQVSLKVIDRHGSMDLETVDVAIMACGPQIDDVQPNPAVPGSEIHLDGLGFGDDPGAGQYATDDNNVTIGGVRVDTDAFISWAADQIVFTLPEGLVSGPLQVTATGQASNEVVFVIGDVSDCLWSSAILPTSGGGQSYGVAWGDFDNDGDPDAFVANNGANHLFINQAGTLVLDDTFAGGDADSRSGVWGDIDNDNDLDLYVVNHDQPNQVFLNEDGQLVERAGGDECDSGSGYNAAFADVDSDSDLDLYLCNDGGISRLLLNTDGDFTSAGGVTEIEGVSRSCAFGDMDNDGDQDLYLCRIGDNLLFVNDGNGGFSANTPAVIADSGHGKSAAWGDYDNDGWLDLVIVNSVGSNHLYRNEGGGEFAEVDVPALAPTLGGRGCVWGDFDNDGWLDLYLTSTQSPDRLLRNVAGEFSDETCGVIADHADLAAWGAAPADYDGDGDLDLFVAIQEWSSPSVLFVNDLVPTVNHWLGVDLDGVVSNTAGIGARISIDTGSQVLPREVGAGNYLSQSPAKVTIGTGAATSVDVTITWPSGLVQILDDVATDQEIVVTEGGQSTGVGDVPAPEQIFARNYPNPFNPSTTIAIGLPTTGTVTLAVYDLRGRLVRTLCEEELRTAGVHKVQWLGNDDKGSPVSSGIYIYQLRAGAERAAGRMTLLK